MLILALNANANRPTLCKNKNVKLQIIHSVKSTTTFMQMNRTLGVMVGEPP